MWCRAALCVLLLLFLGKAAQATDEPKPPPSKEDDLKSLQGRWYFDPSLPRANAYSFEFAGKAVSFSSSGPNASLPKANAVPFEIEESDGKRVLRLGDKNVPQGIGRTITYRFDGARLILTITHGEKKIREYKLVRAKKNE